MHGCLWRSERPAKRLLATMAPIATGRWRLRAEEGLRPHEAPRHCDLATQCDVHATDSYEEALAKEAGQHYILHCSMVVALGNHAGSEVAATHFVGSGRDARGPSQTFSLPDKLGWVFGPSRFSR